MQRKTVILLLVALGSLMGIYHAAAQDDNIIASGLNSPRDLCYDSAGNLFIAEAGIGGDIEVPAPPGPPPPEGQEPQPATLGLTSQISMVAPDGTLSVYLPYMTSVSNAGETLGVQSVYATEDSVWMVISIAGPNMPFRDAVVELDRETYRVKHFIDLFTYEAQNDPDGRGDVDSNANDIAVAPDDTLFIADAGANTVYTWVEGEGLQPFHSWGDNPVPTSVDFDANGDVYVGFLGEGIAPGAGKIERWTRAGELVETFSGLTGVTDIEVTDDGTIYAVQLFTAMGEQGPDMASGNVVSVTADGATPLLEGLAVPYGLAMSPDGQLVVSTSTVFSAPGSGTVVAVPMS